jgi:hypothetical protein
VGEPVNLARQYSAASDRITEHATIALTMNASMGLLEQLADAIGHSIRVA